VEKVPQLPSKAPFSKRFEEAVGQACESASVRQVARQFRLAASTVRAIDLRHLQRWSATRRKDIYDPAVPSPLRNAVGEGSPHNKFHVLQHANKAIDEVRRAEFFRKGGRLRSVVKGKRWLLLTRWMNLDSQKRQQLNELFALNRRVMKAYLLKESLERLWTYRHGALPAELDRSTAMATIATLSKTGPDVGGSPGRNPELLPHQSTFRGRGSHQRQHQNPS
jgi:hypothetical protein